MRRWVRAIYVVAGLISVGLASVGIFVPVVPTVPLVLLAGFFFSRSSKRFDDWLVGHRVFGPIIRDWRAGLGFSARAKAIAVIAILISFGATLTVAVQRPIPRVALISLALAIIAYVLSRPTKRVVPEPVE
jgi:uncharacterized membrane protein YbaN (DUF454 family)